MRSTMSIALPLPLLLLLHPDVVAVAATAAEVLARQGFHACDADSSGAISFQEFKAKARKRSVGPYRTTKELKVLFKALDRGKKGFLNANDYAHFEAHERSLVRGADFFKAHESTQLLSAWMRRSKFIVTSDLFSTASTAIRLKQVLKEMLPKQPASALWIHDARAGWDEPKIARAWLMDGFAELSDLAECGVTSSAGLWINRWKKFGREHGMKMAEQLQPGRYVQRYEDTNLTRVKQVLDRASLLYLPGGEPYSLLDALKHSPEGAAVWAHARRRINAGNLVVLTRSAGSIVVGATVDVTTERPSGWRGDTTGLGLAPKLAFIPHFYLPQMNRLLHSEEWRLDVGRQQWSKDDFLAELASKERVTGIKGVPLREGWFVAYNGEKSSASERWLTHEGPEDYRLPRVVSSIVGYCDKPVWQLLLFWADLRLKMEICFEDDIVSMRERLTILIALVKVGVWAFIWAATVGFVLVSAFTTLRARRRHRR